MGRKTVGFLVAALIISVIFVCLGGFLVQQAPGQAARADTLESVAPVSAATLGELETGAVTIIEGQIDPETPTLARGLAMYNSEEYVRETRRTNGRTRTDYEWERDDSEAPPFTLLAADGAVQIVNSGYTIDTPSYDEPGETNVGALRYEGFRPGDQVLVVGTAAENSISAEAVFGGTQTEYVSALRSRASTQRTAGWILLGCGLIPLLGGVVAALFLWRNMSR